MAEALATVQHQPAQLDAATMEQVVVHNDLSKLTPNERLEYYMRTCEALGLNPLTRPLAYLNLKSPDGNYRLTLYATRDAADQLRRRDAISIQIVNRQVTGDVYVVTVRATTPDGRFDESTGAVPLVGKYGNLTGDLLANAYMKAETKAKRRVTLSISGLGFIDESEVDSIPDARRVQVDDKGEIIDIPVIPMPQSGNIAETAPVAPSNPSSLVLPFGKHKGKTLGQLMTEDNGYVQWLADKSTSPDIKDAAQQLLSEAVITPEPPATTQSTTMHPATISDAQLRLLYALAKQNNVKEQTFKDYAKTKHGVDSSKNITKPMFDDIKAWLERGGQDAAEAEWDSDGFGFDEGETFGDQLGAVIN